MRSHGTLSPTSGILPSTSETPRKSPSTLRTPCPSRVSRTGKGPTPVLHLPPDGRSPRGTSREDPGQAPYSPWANDLPETRQDHSRRAAGNQNSSSGGFRFHDRGHRGVTSSASTAGPNRLRVGPRVIETGTRSAVETQHKSHRFTSSPVPYHPTLTTAPPVCTRGVWTGGVPGRRSSSTLSPSDRTGGEGGEEGPPSRGCLWEVGPEGSPSQTLTLLTDSHWDLVSSRESGVGTLRGVLGVGSGRGGAIRTRG